MTERPLPHDDPAERAVLADVLLDSAHFGEVRGLLDCPSFYSERHCIIWAALCAVVDAGSALDLVTLRRWLAAQGKLEAAGGPAYPAEILDGAVPSRNALHHARIVAELARRRDVIARAAGLQESAWNGTSARDLDELLEGLASARVSERTLEPLPTADLGGAEPVPPEPLVGNAGAQLILPGELCLVASDPGVGKTKLLSEIALAVSSGGECLGFQTNPGPVVYVSSDGDPDLPGNLRRQWLGRGGDPAQLGALPLHLYPDCDFCVEDGTWFRRLEVTLAQAQPALLVLESLSTNVRETDLNDQAAVRQFVNRRLRSLLPAHPRMGVLISCHLRKSQAGGANDLATRVAGSMQVRGAVDSVVGLVPAGRNAFAVRRVKRSRSGGDFEPFTVRILGDRGQPLKLANEGPTETPVEELRGAARAVLDFMRQAGGRQPLKAIVAACAALPRPYASRPAQKACARLAEADPPLLIRVSGKPAAYELPPKREGLDFDEGLE